MRLNKAVDALERFLEQLFAQGDSIASVAKLQEQLRFMTEERDQLLRELDIERGRVRRLSAANDEVSSRLEAVMVTLRDQMPALPG